VGQRTWRCLVVELEPDTVELPAYVTFSERRPLAGTFSEYDTLPVDDRARLLTQ
jgi:hypothetical protein